MRAGAFCLFALLMLPASAEATSAAETKGSWKRALQHQYPADGTEWSSSVRRMSLPEIHELAVEIAKLDNQLQGKKSFLAVEGYAWMRRYELYFDVAIQMYDEGTHPYGNNGSSERMLVDQNGVESSFQLLLPVDYSLEMDGDRESALAATATEFAHLFRSLQEGPWEKRVWQKPYLRYEARTLQMLSNAFSGNEENMWAWQSDTTLIKAAILEMESNRLRLQPETPQFVEVDGAGAGEMAADIAIQPANGVAYRISRFRYLLCKKMDIDAENRDTCLGWKAMRNGDRPQVSGSYEIRVSWPNGKTLSTSMIIDGIKEQKVVLIAPK